MLSSASQILLSWAGFLSLILSAVRACLLQGIEGLWREAKGDAKSRTTGFLLITSAPTMISKP